MKYFISLVLFVGFFMVGGVASAAISSVPGCVDSAFLFSPLTGQKCSTGNVLGATVILVDPTLDNSDTTLSPSDNGGSTSPTNSSTTSSPNERSCSGTQKDITEGPLGKTGVEGPYEQLGMDISAHPEILKYRIQWFSGAWSCWYVPGVGDQDWVTSIDGGLRRVWSYFDDHTHEYIKCVTSSTTPSINILSPNGGEVYKSGQKVTIKWDSGNISKVSVLLHYYSDPSQPGNSEYAIASNIINTGEYSWLIPNSLPVSCEAGTCYLPFGYGYKIMILAEDGSTSRIYDDSNSHFTINSSLNPSPCSQTGAGSENFTLDVNNPSAQSVAQGSTNIELARIKLTNTGSQSICSVNGLQIGSYDNVNSYITNVRVIDTSTNAIYGEAKNIFDNNGSYYWAWDMYELPILSGTSKTLKIIADIKMTSQLGSFKFGIFGVNHSGGYGASASGLPIVGNLVTVKSKTDNTCTSTSTPSITVLAPNGGETYQAGQQVKVQWNTCNIPSNTVAKINLLPITYNGVIVPVPTPNIFPLNAGSAYFTLPSQSNFPPLVYGNYYRFHIDFPSLALNGDDSDNTFTINIPTTTSVPTVISGVALSITPTSAILRSTITSAGTPDAILARGHCYSSTIVNPSLSNNGNGATCVTHTLNTIGIYTTNISGLTPSTLYNYRGYATNATGTAYTSNTIFTTTSVGTTISAGCTSALGYSATTGIPCSNPVVLQVDGCTSMAGYSSTTGQACEWWTQTNSNVTYGCNTTTGFSVTTGQQCTSVTPPPECNGANYSLITGQSCIYESTNTSSNTDLTFTRKLKLGLRGDDVKVLQERLLSEGVYSGPITGYYGFMTQGGVKKFQEENELSKDGIVGPMTLKALNE